MRASIGHDRLFVLERHASRQPAIGIQVDFVGHKGNVAVAEGKIRSAGWSLRKAEFMRPAGLTPDAGLFIINPVPASKSIGVLIGFSVVRSRFPRLPLDEMLDDSARWPLMVSPTKNVFERPSVICEILNRLTKTKTPVLLNFMSLLVSGGPSVPMDSA